jgi:hypothetical protein
MPNQSYIAVQIASLMTKKFVKAELKSFTDSNSIYELGWSFLFGYSSKLLSLINDANDLNCKADHIQELNFDLLRFQDGITIVLIKTGLRDIYTEPEFKSAIIEMNRLKRKFIAVCLDD